MRGPTSGRLPFHGWLGLGLIAVFWPLNWMLPGERTIWGFFPLWLGYCLAVDGVNVRRRGTSLLTRSAAGYVSLFLLSVPIWWLFEAINRRTRNWIYVGGERLDDLEYAFWASLSFSTVVPAVFGTAELMAGSGFVRRLHGGPALAATRAVTAGLSLTGLIMLSLLLTWPDLFYPCVWLSIVLIVEPLNSWLANRSLLEWTARRDWRPLIALCAGALVCGFFWELWNFWSYPRWVYRVPFFGFWHVFEMPLLGYLGYIPFALELFVVVHLLYGLAGRGDTSYVSGGLEAEDRAAS